MVCGRSCIWILLNWSAAAGPGSSWFAVGHLGTVDSAQLLGSCWPRQFMVCSRSFTVFGFCSTAAGPGSSWFAVGHLLYLDSAQLLGSCWPRQFRFAVGHIYFMVFSHLFYSLSPELIFTKICSSKFRAWPTERFLKQFCSKHLRSNSD